MQSNAGKKEFVSPKLIDNLNISRNESGYTFPKYSPLILPQLGIGVQNVDEENQHNLRRRSSQIISGDASFNKEGATGCRDREDSITAFKKFEKGMMADF